MKKLLLAFALFGPLLVLARAAEIDWSPFQFMIGEWVGSGSGKPGQGFGEFSLRLDLAGKVLVRRNRSEYPPQAGQTKGLTHEDLMIVYPSRGADSFRADFFDSEGHVIHYAVSFSEGKVVFLSDGSRDVPRFRLTYQKKSDNILGIDFEMAPPNQDFHPYLSGTVNRR